uniref:Aconitase domain-containing protein n=1 Tax=Heterorhabditis bacteriophora TaxID=37862 RepID=A0A1I7WA58_HETBA
MPYQSLLKDLKIDGATYKYYDLTALNDDRYGESNFSCISYSQIVFWIISFILLFQYTNYPFPFDIFWKQLFATVTNFIKPSMCFSGVPAVVDLASMRDAVEKMGADPGKINPVCPVDLVIDHSVQVDHYGNLDALAKNQVMEFERNKERFNFLKWGSKAFNNLLIVPPGSGIVHQVNLEYLARTVFADRDGLLYPDSVVGTDSHTTMIGGSNYKLSRIRIFKGFGLTADEIKNEVTITNKGRTSTLSHGSVVIAAITSCTNTSNPSVMLAAGLVAKKVVILKIFIETYVNLSTMHPYIHACRITSSWLDPPLAVVYSIIGNIKKDINGVIGLSSYKSIVHFKNRIDCRFMLISEKVLNSGKSWNAQKLIYIHGIEIVHTLSECHFLKICKCFNSKIIKVDLPTCSSISNAYCLLNLGDSVTTDHISPAGSISRVCYVLLYINMLETFKYVSLRVLLSNIRLVNKLASKVGPQTLHVPSGEELDVYDVAEKYRKEGYPVKYGNGSSRDWAAKGPFLLGVKAIQYSENISKIRKYSILQYMIRKLIQ